ncbi:MAG: hypothetical protein PVG54_16095 [Anaerolineae bacterium]
MLLSSMQLQQAKSFIFERGRLLERNLYLHFFEGGSLEACQGALHVYQNPDGGFGNGLEPDLLCPDSTAIGAETALYVCDVLGYHDETVMARLTSWLVANQNEQGFIEHPPERLANYPHQPWWENPDDERALVLAGLLKRRGIVLPDFFAGVRRYYCASEFRPRLSFYSYPCFVYLMYCSEGQEDQERLSCMMEQVPAFLDVQRAHFPLFSRYWFYVAELCEAEIVQREAARFVAALQDDGGIENPYPDLPWWRPIFTLDGLILMKKYGLI